ncbi:centrosomal protein of 97 kDa [Petromyzon marinus]|uniref:centrosomal protein of 97 kDa n=1 Tax=Petromyzon marinus TaxID=7757 RepID=UPI003F70DFA3
MAAHLDITASEGRVVDLSDRGLVRLSVVSLPTDACTLVLDSNNLAKLDGVESCRHLMQLSAAENSLVRMGGVARLSSLKQLNLPRNSIPAIEGLKDLCHLQWLNLAGNSIKTIEHLNGCTSLTYVDLSDNNISHLGDMSKLSNLRTLLLHGNMVTSLRTAPTHLPPQLGILSLAENEITDLTEMSHLSCLRSLEQLSVMKNPCMLSAPSAPACDHRPYVLSWCLTLRVLDGHVVTQKESLKAEWLYSQGRGRSFRPGQHAQLIGYLAQVCPQSTSPQLITAEDAKLQKILKQQQRHQKELMEELKQERHRSLSLEASQTPSSLNPGDSSSLTYSEPASETPDRPIKVNLWMGGGGLHENASPALSQRTAASKLGVRPVISDLHLEDVHSEDDRLGSSMLLSESTFMMCPSLLPSPKSGEPVGVASNGARTPFQQAPKLEDKSLRPRQSPQTEVVVQKTLPHKRRQLPSVQGLSGKVSAPSQAGEVSRLGSEAYGRPFLKGAPTFKSSLHEGKKIVSTQRDVSTPSPCLQEVHEEHNDSKWTLNAQVESVSSLRLASSAAVHLMQHRDTHELKVGTKAQINSLGSKAFQETVPQKDVEKAFQKRGEHLNRFPIAASFAQLSPEEKSCGEEQHNRSDACNALQRGNHTRNINEPETNVHGKSRSRLHNDEVSPASLPCVKALNGGSLADNGSSVHKNSDNAFCTVPSATVASSVQFLTRADRQMDCTEANAEHLVGEKSPDRGGGHSPRVTDKSTRRHNVKPGLPTECAAGEMAPCTGEAFEPIGRESPASQESCSPSGGRSNIGGGVAVKIGREAGPVRSFGPRARSAAVRIQAAWRGYRAREHDERVRAARGEMRLRRLQEHVVYLAQELERLRSMHEAERRERLVQTEAVKYLWSQVRTLHEWKEEFTQSIRMQSTFAGQKPESQEALPLANEWSAQGTADKESAASVESEASDSDSSDDSDSSGWSEGRPEDTPSHAPHGVAVQSSPSDGEPSLTQEYLHSVQLMVEEEEKEEMVPEPEGSVNCTLNYETSVDLSGQLPQDDLSERSPVGGQTRPEALTAGVPADTVTTAPPGEVLPSAELSAESRSADAVAENGSVDVSEASSGFRVPSLVPDSATCGCESDVHAVSDEAGLDLPKAVPPPPPLSPPEVGVPPVAAGTVGADDISLAVENVPGGQALGVSVDADGQDRLHQLAQTETPVSKQAMSLSRASSGHSSLVSLV